MLVHPPICYILTQASICSETGGLFWRKDIIDGYILTQASICSETVYVDVIIKRWQGLHLNSSQHLL